MNEKSSQDLLNELTAGRFTEEERSQMDGEIVNFLITMKQRIFGKYAPKIDFQYMEDYLRCSSSFDELNSRMNQILSLYK